MNDELTPSERSALRAQILGGARGIKPVGAHRNAVIAGSIAAVLVVAIAGGVAATSTLSAPEIAATPTPTETATSPPAPTSAPSPTPTATPTSVSRVTQPAPRFAFACDDVAQTVRGYFGGEVVETVDTRPSPRGNSWTRGPMQYSFAQAGAVYCEFGDPEATWLTVAVVPDAEGAIEDRDSLSGGECDPENPPCELVAGSYILVEGAYAGAEREDAVPALDAAYDSMRDLVLASPPSPSVWAPPAGTTPLTGDCATFLPAERLSLLLGQDGMIIEPVGRGGWSLQSWMMSGYWDAPFCTAHQSGVNQYEDPLLMSIIWLPGGEWAFDGGAPGQPLAVTGGQQTDAARLSCQQVEYGASCSVDVLVDGNWVRIGLPFSSDESGTGVLAAQIAETVFAQVYG
ncbi:hypothetical protein [Microbacterium sp. Leaf151]|uniref:hypothetical protein n=1 Tax=Microbacterium sp. Leaf151 TaxID=1736276 RepID=UPI000A632BB4|nr:hypothetical protein [Microbacterium sp. Leaf151]